MLYMAAPIATSAIRTNRTNVVGIGLQLKSRIDREALGMTQEAADAWQAQAEREFALWSENKRACDATGDVYKRQGQRAAVAFGAAHILRHAAAGVGVELAVALLDLRDGAVGGRCV